MFIIPKFRVGEKIICQVFINMNFKVSIFGKRTSQTLAWSLNRTDSCWGVSSQLANAKCYHLSLKLISSELSSRYFEIRRTHIQNTLQEPSEHSTLEYSGFTFKWCFISPQHCIPALLSFLSTSMQNTGILSFLSFLSKEGSSKKSTYGMLIFHAARLRGVFGVVTASSGESSSITITPSSICKDSNRDLQFWFNWYSLPLLLTNSLLFPF